jgi:putative flippase GtrA
VGLGRGGVGRASLSSVGATLTDYAVFVALVHAGALAPLATLCGCIVGGGLNFTINRYWAFRDGGPALRAILRYATVSGSSALANAALVWVATESLGMSPRLAWMCARVSVFLGLTYPLFRRWVFVSQSGMDGRSKMRSRWVRRRNRGLLAPNA